MEVVVHKSIGKKSVIKAFFRFPKIFQKDQTIRRIKEDRLLIVPPGKHMERNIGYINSWFRHGTPPYLLDELHGKIFAEVTTFAQGKRSNVVIPLPWAKAAQKRIDL